MLEQEKLMEDEAKKKKERERILAPTLKTQSKLSQLSQTKLTQLTQNKIFFKVFKYLLKSKFSIQNFHSQILNLNHKFSKI